MVSYSNPTSLATAVDPITMDTESIKVWIIEDNEAYRNSIELVIDAAKDLHVTGSFDYCESLIKKHSHYSFDEYPDVILLDINFISSGRKAKMTGIEGIQEIKKKFPKTPILMLTDSDESSYIFQALQRGASGFLYKTTRTRDIQDAVRMAYRGGIVVPPTVASKLLMNFQEVDVESENSLTKRERQIIELMAHGKTRKSIADELFISPNTVDSHLNKIYQKLGVSTGTEAVAKIYGARSPLRPKSNA